MSRFRLLTAAPLVLLLLACSHADGAEVDPPLAFTSQARKAEAKASVPVDVVLRASGSAGRVVLTLTVTALADLPRVVGRIVLPSGVVLAAGDKQLDLGPLPLGAVRELPVTVEVPASGRFQIFAGVDVYLSPTVIQHKTAEPLALGQ